MIEFYFNTVKTGYACTFYHEWDIDLDDVVQWEKVTSDSIDKYVKFNDGSNLYAKIYATASNLMYVITSVGMFKRHDLVKCSSPRSTSSHIGMKLKDVHPVVFPYTLGERMIANKILGGFKPKYVTRRVRMRTQEDLGEEAIEQGMTKGKFVQRLIQEFNIVEGRNFPVAAKALGLLVFDADITKREELSAADDPDNKPLLEGGNLQVSDSPQSRAIATIRDIRKMCNVVRPKGKDDVEILNSEEINIL